MGKFLKIATVAALMLGAQLMASTADAAALTPRAGRCEVIISVGNVKSDAQPEYDIEAVLVDGALKTAAAAFGGPDVPRPAAAAFIPIGGFGVSDPPKPAAAAKVDGPVSNSVKPAATDVPNSAASPKAAAATFIPGGSKASNPAAAPAPSRPFVSDPPKPAAAARAAAAAFRRPDVPKPGGGLPPAAAPPPAATPKTAAAVIDIGPDVPNPAAAVPPSAAPPPGATPKTAAAVIGHDPPNPAVAAAAAVSRPFVTEPAAPASGTDPPKSAPTDAPMPESAAAASGPDPPNPAAAALGPKEWPYLLIAEDCTVNVGKAVPPSSPLHDPGYISVDPVTRHLLIRGARAVCHCPISDGSNFRCLCIPGDNGAAAVFVN